MREQEKRGEIERGGGRERGRDRDRDIEEEEERASDIYIDRYGQVSED